MVGVVVSCFCFRNPWRTSHRCRNCGDVAPHYSSTAAGHDLDPDHCGPCSVTGDWRTSTCPCPDDPESVCSRIPHHTRTGSAPCDETSLLCRHGGCGRRTTHNHPDGGHSCDRPFGGGNCDCLGHGYLGPCARTTTTWSDAMLLETYQVERILVPRTLFLSLFFSFIRLPNIVFVNFDSHRKDFVF